MRVEWDFPHARPEGMPWRAVRFPSRFHAAPAAWGSRLLGRPRVRRAGAERAAPCSGQAFKLINEQLPERWRCFLGEEVLEGKPAFTSLGPWFCLCWSLNLALHSAVVQLGGSGWGDLFPGTTVSVVKEMELLKVIGSAQVGVREAVAASWKRPALG